MPILPRTVTSPKKFIIGHDLLPQLHDHVKDFGDNALLVSDEFILERVREEALAGLLQAGLKGAVEKFNYECTDIEIRRLLDIGQNAAGIGNDDIADGIDIANAVQPLQFSKPLKKHLLPLTA